MMRYSANRSLRNTAFAAASVSRARFAHNRFEGYQYSLLAPPVPRPANDRALDDQPYTVRAVAPSLRPLVARYGNRCPECAGPLVNGEGCVACPVCGFRRQGW